MKIIFKKLGVIQQGELVLNDLTLLCRPNNTGKTDYVMYSLYGLLDEKFGISFKFVQNIVEKLIAFVQNIVEKLIADVTHLSDIVTSFLRKQESRNGIKVCCKK